MALDRTKNEVIGFGFEASKGGHHFVVRIPRAEEGVVLVAEHFVYGEEVEEAAARARFSDEPQSLPIRQPSPKVEISLYKWQRVAEDVRAEFNRRLRESGLKASAWKVGENHLSAYLGKELVLLLWAIEDADPSMIPNAVANWQGLAPEERWWLYTTINAATGHISSGRGWGWRKAIGIAFTENTVTERPYLSQSNLPASKNGIYKNGTESVKRNSKRRKPNPDSDAPTLPFDESKVEP